MKTKTSKILTIIMFLGLILLAGCSTQVDEKPDENKEVGDDFNVTYSDGYLKYEGVITKPNPCYELKIDEQIMESYPVKIRLDIETIPPAEGEMCIQVIEEETVEGEIEINHVPGSFSVYLDDEQIYSTTNIMEE